MTSSYNDIYSRFLNKIRDYEFAGLPEPNAMAEVKPNVVFTVPLVLEKIYSKMIVPMISRGAL